MKVFILVVLCVYIIFSCQDDSTMSPVETSEGSITLTIDMTMKPAQVSTVDGRLSRSDVDTVFFDFITQGDSAVVTVENLKSGEWLLEVFARDIDGIVTHSGSATVNVVAGVTTQVTIYLSEILGGLQIVVHWITDQHNSRDANPQLDDPLRTFENIPTEVREIKFRRGNTEFPDGGHFQGIQSFYDSYLEKQICFISGSSYSKAYFITVAFDPGPQNFGEIRHFQYLPSDGNQPPLRHPGGIQLIGKYLVVGVEDNQNKHRSQVQFWDVSDPFAPKQRTPLTVIRESATPKDKTAGAVGIVKRANDHLLVVANWDAKALDFYASNGWPLGDDACWFTFTVRWTSDEANKGPWAPDENWGNYQGINLVCDRNFNIFLLGFETNSISIDLIDFFSVDLANDPPNIIRKLSTKHIILKGGVHFQHSGGIFIKSSTELSCYATEQDNHVETNVNVSW